MSRQNWWIFQILISCRISTEKKNEIVAYGADGVDKQMKGKSFEESLMTGMNKKVFKNPAKIVAMVQDKDKLLRYVEKKNALAGKDVSRHIRIDPAKAAGKQSAGPK